jgi:hypothetical protein
MVLVALAPSAFALAGCRAPTTPELQRTFVKHRQVFETLRQMADADGASLRASPHDVGTNLRYFAVQADWPNWPRPATLSEERFQKYCDLLGTIRAKRVTWWTSRDPDQPERHGTDIFIYSFGFLAHGWIVRIRHLEEPPSRSENVVTVADVFSYMDRHPNGHYVAYSRLEGQWYIELTFDE